MEENTNIAAEAVAAIAEHAEKKVKFSVDEIGYTSLSGGRIKLQFDQRDLAETIYMFSRGISIDRVAKSIFDTGEAECSESDLDTILQVIEQKTDFGHRVKMAVREYIENLKGE